jgi:hypothetical protein
MIELTRDYKSLLGTHGTFALDGKEWHTIEKPDLGNRPFESCIPLGDYTLTPFDSPKFGPCFIMSNPDLNVYQFEGSPGRPDNGRFLCLFVHRGNEIDNFVGCIGASHAYDETRDRLLSSTRAACETINSSILASGERMLRISHEFE